MRRALGLGFLVLTAVAAWVVVRDAEHARTANGELQVTHFRLHSKLLGRDLNELLVTPAGGGQGAPLLVFLHGHGASPGATFSDAFRAGLLALGDRAPVVLLPGGGKHSYWHDRRDGRWGSYVLREAIPAALVRSGADPRRVAIGGVSMGGFGALDLGRVASRRFCAIGAHSAALWVRGGDTPAGAFDDARDFARHDVIAFARAGSPYRVPVWLDTGTKDPFRVADVRLANELRVDRAPLTFHVWPGGHEGRYWDRHIAQYLRFYANACE
jgi:poly(3-hydroxybutyrate) depolymerase